MNIESILGRTSTHFSLESLLMSFFSGFKMSIFFSPSAMRRHERVMFLPDESVSIQVKGDCDGWNLFSEVMNATVLRILFSSI